MGSIKAFEGPAKLLSAAIERLWAGERDWQALAEDLDLEWALVVLQVLEEVTRIAGTNGSLR
jgi:hypothetical protein